MKADLFTQVKMTKPKKNFFDLSHEVKQSMDMGNLIPIVCMECVPGDKVTLGCDALVRFAPMVAPVMHQVNVFTHYFFVPYRIIWENWEEYVTSFFTTEPPPAFPYMIARKNMTLPPLANYMGIPFPIITAEADINVSALPFAAYQKIWYEYYRDQNLDTGITEANITVNDGSNGALDLNNALTTIRKRCWEHDYFTSALPFAQKGDPVDIPLGDVQLKANWATNTGSTIAPSWRDETGLREAGAMSQDTLTGGNFTGDIGVQLGGDTTEAFAYDPQGSLATAPVTINELRTAFRLQEYLEKDARGGTRYTEHIRAHFGVHSSDKRLQRPEYITGTKAPVIISEVLNTTGTVDAPQGDMAGHGLSVTNGKYGSYFCEEHGYIIGIMSILPRTAYQQGIPKHFLKITSPTELFYPEFAHLGEQEILNKEIYAWGTNQDGVFGYTPRYAEYKYMPSRVAGLDFSTTLNHWHMGRIFDTQPALNAAFVRADPTKRIFAVTDPNLQSMWVHIKNNIKALRPMPKFGTPSF